MAAKLRTVLASQTAHILREIEPSWQLPSLRHLTAAFRLGDRRHFVKLRRPSLRLDIGGLVPRLSSRNLSDLVARYPTSFLAEGGQDGHEPPPAACAGVVLSPEEGRLHFLLEPAVFVSHVLRETAARPLGYQWGENALFTERLPKHHQEGKKKVVVEFSSPNIAKPFHVGHFRSAIVGNFVANIYEAVGHEVVRLNYLGDWGTQFGYLMAGLDRSHNAGILLQDSGGGGDEDNSGDRSGDILRHLLDVYVRTNREAASDPLLESAARLAFHQLEAGQAERLAVWASCRHLSVAQLTATYDRLNIRFDAYDGESMYQSTAVGALLADMRASGVLRTAEDGRQVVDINDNLSVTVVKSDGSSLYMSRDIAAALDRQERFAFDQMFYVVDNSQAIHFENLFHILYKMGHTWAVNKCAHVRFGRVLGMSTRRGQMVLLSHLVDEARLVMLEMQQQAKTTRVYSEEVAERLGIAALLVNDLRHPRKQDYKFSWSKALNPSGETGVRLQYAHARLHSLLEKAELPLDLRAASTQPLTEDSALDLVHVLGQWDEVLSSSYHSLEPSLITQYLFTLVSSTNRALKELPVKGSEPDTARARLLLFYCSQKVIAEGLRIIGVEPLDQM